MKYSVLFFLAFFTHAAFAAPSLNSVKPPSGFQGATLSLTIAGAGFVPGETEVRFSDPRVLINDVRVISATSLVANVSLLADPGRQEISVFAGGTSNTLRFEILPGSLSKPENGVVTHFSGPVSFFGTLDARGTDARF